MNFKKAGRKFFIATACIAIATGLLLARLITNDHWIDAVKWVTGLYMAGNVGARVTDQPKVKP